MPCAPPPAGPRARWSPGRRCPRAWRRAAVTVASTVCPSEPTTTRSPWKSSRRWASAGAISTRRSGCRKCSAGDTRTSVAFQIERKVPRRRRPLARGAGRRLGLVLGAGLALELGGGEGARPRRAPCQRTPLPPISSSVRPGVEGHRRDELGGGHRPGEDAEVEAHARGPGRRCTDHSARTSPGWPIAARRRCRRPSGCVSVPVLLGVALGREDDGGVLAHAVGEEVGVGDDGGGALERGLPPGAPGQVGRPGRRAAGRARSARPRGRRRRSPAASRPARLVAAKPGPGVGQHARLGQAAAVGGRRARTAGPRPRGRRAGSGARRGRAARGRPARRAGPRPGARRRGSRRPRRPAARAPSARTASDSAPAACGEAVGLRARGPASKRGRQRQQEGLAGAGREADAGGRVGVQRRRAARGHGELDAVAAHALADAQVDDRHVVDGLAVEHEDGVGELEVGDRRLRGGRAQRAVQRRAAASPPARESRSGEPRPSRIRRCRRKPSSLVRLAAGDRADAPVGALERRRPPRRARAPRRPGAARRRRGSSAA